MPIDPLDMIAESYRGIHESTQVLAQTATKLHLLQRAALRLQTFALGLLGLALVGTGALIWHGLHSRQEHAAFMQALTAQSREHAALIQALTVQTEALRQQLK